MNRAMLRAIVAAALLAAGAGAWAHAFLDHAEPKVGATVPVPPRELRLWFSQAVEPAFSTAQVVDANGHRVDTGPAQADASDRSVLRVPLGPLAPGAYTVNWRAVSVDTHPTTGHFTFRVGP